MGARSGWITRVAGLSTIAVAVAANGCFYDSRWGQAEREQRRNAARATPATLGGRADDGEAAAPTTPSRRVRTVRLRVYATPAYQTQTIEWRRQLRDLVEDAGKVLEPSLGAHLEIASTATWDAPSVDEDLARSLDALRAQDDGADVDLVVALVGGLPRVTPSFHELGMAELLGKHLVVRAAAKAEERDTIDRAFDALKGEERRRLAQARKRHRATAVFLHEIGHTLGAMHERDAQSLMSPAYDPRMRGFSADAIDVMRVVLDHRRDADARALAGDLARVLRAKSDATWAPGERDASIARCEAILARARGDGSDAAAPTHAASEDAPPSTATEESAAPDVPADVAALPDEARAAWTAAAQSLGRGDPATAWRTARPLFAAYPTVYAVQDLRCRIAMRAGFDWTTTRAECDPLMKLSTSGPKRRSGGGAPKHQPDR